MADTDTVEIPSISRDFLYLPGIRAFDSRSPDHAADPTTVPIEVAFTALGAEPGDADWTAAEWVDTTTARILIGPTTGVALSTGWYKVWLRVTGASEQPERAVGSLTVR